MRAMRAFRNEMYFVVKQIALSLIVRVASSVRYNLYKVVNLVYLFFHFSYTYVEKLLVATYWGISS